MQPPLIKKHLLAVAYSLSICLLPYICIAQAVQPSINTTALTGNIYACVGTYSANPNIGQFTVSGTGLTTDINAYAPSGFELSFNADNGYASSIAIKQSGGIAANTIVYVRLVPIATAGVVTGNASLSANNGNVITFVALNGDAAVLPVADPVASQTVTSGQATKAINFTGTTPNFSWTNDNPSIGLAASGKGDIASFKAINKGTSPVKATITVTPEANPGYAYITNSLGNSVSIINTSTLQLVPNNITTSYPGGVAVSPDGQNVYIANEGNNSVIEVNTTTNEIVSTTSVGDRPLGVVVSPDNTTVYVTNFNSNDITVINPPSPHTLTIPLQPYGTNPECIAVTRDGSSLYVDCGVSSSLVIVNTAKEQVSGRILYNSSQAVPYGLVLSPDGTKIYGAALYFYTINVSDNTYTQTSLGSLVGGGVCISPDGNTAYICNNKTDLVLGDVLVYNLATNTIIATIQVGYEPTGISITPDGHYVYLTNFYSNNVSVINTTSNTVIATIPVGTLPIGLGNFIKPGNDCSGVPITFTITVNPSSGNDGTGNGAPSPPPVTIPNTFTPNGDGINDVWNINGIEKFPTCTVNVFNRYGEKLYSSVGYTIPWDGTYKGSALPVGTYYYVIDLKDGYSLLSGYVTIIK